MLLKLLQPLWRQIVLKFHFCAGGGDRSKPEFLEGLCSEKRARAQIPKPGDVYCVVLLVHSLNKLYNYLLFTIAVLWIFCASILMFELIAAAFLFLSFQKGGEGCKAMKCQWRGNSLNKAVGFALCPKKTIGGPQSLDSLNFSFFYNLLRREGRFQTRLFLHFSGVPSQQLAKSSCQRVPAPVIK